MKNPARFQLAVTVSLLLGGNVSFADPAVRYVDAQSSEGDGTSWANAFPFLQDALLVAQQGDEVWVASGMYRPDERSDWAEGGTADREASFHLLSGVTLLGGFPPGGGNLAERDWREHATILSGDINQDDFNDSSSCCAEHEEPGCDDSDCESWVCAGLPECCNTEWTDICAGNAEFICGALCGTAAENSFHVVTGTNTDASAILDGFTVTAGYANGTSGSQEYSGGGMYNSDGHPTIRNTTFTANSAMGGGNAVYNDYSHPVFMHCQFISNAPVFTQITSGGSGGAIYNWLSDPTLINCLFVGNNTGGFGGGGAISGTLSAPIIVNCSFAGNIAGESGGGAIVITSSGDTPTTIRNSIFWNNLAIGPGSEIKLTMSAIADVSFSNVRGGWPGEGNIDVDPRFVAADWDSVIVGGADLRLEADSPCIDAGDNTAVPVGVVTDLDWNSRFFDYLTPDTGIGPPPIVDMGAYEFQGDCNQNGVPDIEDTSIGTSEDCDSDSVPDECEHQSDSDGLIDECDNCPAQFNPGQNDADGDQVGDACDNCPNVPNPDQDDSDEDTIADACDNCPEFPNSSQLDSDHDGMGNACDACPNTPTLAGADSDGHPLGDTNHDCLVTLQDFPIVSSCFGRTGPSGTCDAREFADCDLNSDGVVNLVDFAAFAFHFNNPGVW